MRKGNILPVYVVILSRKRGKVVKSWTFKIQVSIFLTFWGSCIHFVPPKIQNYELTADYDQNLICNTRATQFLLFTNAFFMAQVEVLPFV